MINDDEDRNVEHGQMVQIFLEKKLKGVTELHYI